MKERSLWTSDFGTKYLSSTEYYSIFMYGIVCFEVSLDTQNADSIPLLCFCLSQLSLACECSLEPVLPYGTCFFWKHDRLLDCVTKSKE